MNFFQRLFSTRKTYQVDDVFTASASLENYISRPVLERKLRQYLNNKGKQIIVYGQSGGGKTTLLERVKRTDEVKIIESLCLKSTTINSLIRDAFDQLDNYYTSERFNSESLKSYDKFKSDFKLIGTEHYSEESSSSSEKSERIVDIQITAQRLATFLGQANLVWLIDDFHKIKENEKEEFSQMLKVFSTQSKKYPKLKIICVGAQRTAREVINYDNEMDGRVSELQVELLTEDQIKEMILNGFNLLNVEIEDKLVDTIVTFSNNLATVAHNLCNQLCYDTDIVETYKKTISLSEVDFTKTIKGYIETKEDTYKKSLDIAISQKRQVRYNNGLLILKAIVKLGKEQYSNKEILLKIRETEQEYPQGNLTLYLKQLCSVEKDEILTFDEDSNRYSFRDPFMFGFATMYFNHQPKKIEVGEEKTGVLSFTEKLQNALINEVVNHMRDLLN